MARNSEKAKSVLYRWQQLQRMERGLAVWGAGKKPKTPDQVTSVGNSIFSYLKGQAEHWRTNTINEMSRNISKIKDNSLSEFQIRDLNDEINKLLKDVQKWNFRIKELGGPDYTLSSNKIVDEEGREVLGNKGYLYFGLARELPGVKELFTKKEIVKERERGRFELVKLVDDEYYGLLEDDELFEEELEVELRYLPPIYREWAISNDIIEDDELPGQNEVEEFLVEKIKQDLLAKYS